LLDSLLLDPHRRRLLVSMASGVLGQLASLVAPILLLPAMLRYLGEVDFGIWSSAIALAGLAAILDFGVGNAILTRVAKARALGNLAVVGSYLTSAYVILAIVGGAGLMLLLLGIRSVFATASAWPIFAIVMAAFFLSLPLSIIYRTLYAYQRIPLHSALQVCGALLSVTLALVAIHAAAPVWVVVLAYSFSPVGVMLAATLWFFIREPSVVIGRSNYRRRTTSGLLESGSKFFLLSVLTAFGTNADIILISLFAGPEAVANFVPPMRIGSVLAILVVNLFMPLWSFNGAAFARGEYDWVRKNTILMSIGGCALVALTGGVMLAVSHELMTLWMGRVFDSQDVVLLGMVALAAVTALTSPFNMVLNARGFAAAQIKPWLIFVGLSLAIKPITIYAGYVALIPLQTAILYTVCVSPAMISKGLRILSKRA
jgi:O-antigen/teichoic acid export membrane protein